MAQRKKPHAEYQVVGFGALLCAGAFYFFFGGNLLITGILLAIAAAFLALAYNIVS